MGQHVEQLEDLSPTPEDEPARAIKTLDEERDFDLGELFFSTTDLKGRIQQANSVFRRIADYSWEELKNKPHNIIRHPDMPRVVFQILWEYLEGGKLIVGYVKNRARDGRFYWVVALMVPIPDGYLSVRFKPSSPLFATVKNLYTELREIEAASERESKDKKAAMAASREVLTERLQDLGFNSYEGFMHELLKREMRCREQALHDSAAPVGRAMTAATDSAELDALIAAAQTFDTLLQVLSVLYGDLESYVEINKGLRKKSENVTEISKSLRIIALNGAVQVDILGAEAVGLRPVLDWLQSSSLEITKEGSSLSASLIELIEEVDMVVFSLSAAKLQVEMNAQFAHELVDEALTGKESADSMQEGTIECLHTSSCETVRRALSSLQGVKARLKGLTQSQSKLLDLSHSLQPIYLKGRIEMAGEAGSSLETVFNDVDDQLNETLANINGLKDLVEGLETHLIRGLEHGMRVEETITQVNRRLRAIARIETAEKADATALRGGDIIPVLQAS